VSDPCLFCRVGAGELDVATVAASDAAVAFLDLHPHAPGHTVVIPRVHAATLAELPRDQVGPLFELAQEAARKLEEVLQPDGMTIGINQGVVAGQGIDHVHVHLMPRFKGDGGSNIHAVVKNPPNGSHKDQLASLTS
jgi:histidine triad (HIT) family protein